MFPASSVGFEILFASEKGASMIHSQPPIHPDDLMKPDLLSEILLAASGIILFVPLLLILATALAHSAVLH
jgi:hypothetical protein